MKGFINLDIVSLPGVNVTHDLNKTPYPFNKNHFDEVFCQHILEHVDDLFLVMEELSRICKKGAKINIIAPYFSGQGAFNDPQHTRFFSYKTFDYFRKGSYHSKAEFNILKKRIFFFSSRAFMKSKWFSLPFDLIINLIPIVYQRFFCWIFPSSEVHYSLEVIK
ncbi:MAG: methyltransferase domain-containing protein [archaeon]